MATKLTKYLLHYPFLAYSAIANAAEYEKKTAFLCEAYRNAIRTTVKKKAYRSVMLLWYSLGQIYYQQVMDYEEAISCWNHVLVRSRYRFDDDEAKEVKDSIVDSLSKIHLRKAITSNVDPRTKQESIAELKRLFEKTSDPFS